MNIVVCVKPVRLKYVHSDVNTSNEWVMNPYDTYALSGTIQLKKKIENLHITCISMGPLDAQCILTQCLAMGADECVLLSDQCFSGSDTYATVYILAEAIKKIRVYDLIVCGKQAVDGETGQVPFGLAYRLGMSCFIQVEEVLSVNHTSIQFSRRLDQYRETIEVKSPVLLSFNKPEMNGELNLMRLKKARNIPITVWNHSDINANPEYCGSKGAKTKVLDLKQSFEKKSPVFMEGSNREKVQKLLEIIKQEER